MIDFHSHIIPEIDDGSRSIEETMLLLEEAQKAGFTKIISTSHYLEDRYKFDESSRKQFLDMLKIGASNLKLDLELYLGSEIYTSYDIVDLLKEHKASTINGTNYVLIELPMQSELPNLKNVIYELLGNGYIPIIAHPERYYYVQDNLEVLNDYLKMGCLLSGNILALAGKYGRRQEKTLKKLLQDGKIFCLAVDAHKPADYVLVDAKKKLLRIMKDEAKMRELLEVNPGRIIGGK